jgi:hypothetical protein
MIEKLAIPLEIYDLPGFAQFKSIFKTSAFAIFHSSFMIEKLAIPLEIYELRFTRLLVGRKSS